ARYSAQHDLKGGGPIPMLQVQTMHSYYSSRGRTSYSGNSTRSSTSLPGDRDILEGLSKITLQTIPKLSKVVSDKEVQITGLKYAGSYNWVDESTPTIIVPGSYGNERTSPGSPPQWTNRTLPYQVHADDGLSFKDQNGFRCPNSPLLTIVTAINHINRANKEEFDWASIDFITDRNNLRKLLKWINGTANDFRIDVQLAGKTVLFTRWENRYREQMSGKTFGFNFEKASTSPAPGCRKSAGHHRIITYDLNDLKLLVRFEVDACIPTASVKSPTAQTTASSPSTALDDIIGALSSVKLSKGDATPASPVKPRGSKTFPTVNVIDGGSIVPQTSIMELTTRSNFNASNYDWKDAYPQLFLSQTPHHFLAVHQRGRFHEIQKRKLDSVELKAAARQEQLLEDFKKLRRLLDQIKELVKKH
ncbi:hypothetical protein H0H93_011081, partial [Arthromyces matolae]